MVFRYEISVEVTTINIKKQYERFVSIIESTVGGDKFDGQVVKAVCVSPVKYSRRYIVNKSVMAFKKRGKEAYNEKRTRAWIAVEVFADIPFSKQVSSMFSIDKLVDTSLKSAGFFNCSIYLTTSADSSWKDTML